MYGQLRLDQLTRLGGGREAEIFAVDEKRVLRLARDPGREAAVEREVTALVAAGHAGAPVPALYERVNVDGRPGAVIERLDGEDLLIRLGRRPWSIWSIGRTLGQIHARLHRVPAPNELPSLRDELRSRLASELVPPYVREPALQALDQLPDGEQLCHGDFHPANVLPRAGGYAVVDWTSGARGHPAADVARTCLLMTLGEVPPDAPLPVRQLEPVGRRFLLASYVRGYGRELPVDQVLVKRWRSVCAAARLAEDINGERESLLVIAGSER